MFFKTCHVNVHYKIIGTFEIYITLVNLGQYENSPEVLKLCKLDII